MAGPRGHRQVGGAWSSGPWEPIVTNVRPPRHGPRPRTAEIRTETAHTQHEKVALRYAFHTNSLRQTFNRRVVQAALEGAPVTAVPVGGAVNAGKSGVAEAPVAAGAGHAGGLMLPNAQKSSPGTPRPGLQTLSLVYAIPDHPWVDSANGAAVRIAMTVGQSHPVRAEPVEAQPGRLLTVTDDATAKMAR
jgi:hypothetical protein